MNHRSRLRILCSTACLFIALACSGCGDESLPLPVVLEKYNITTEEFGNACEMGKAELLHDKRRRESEIKRLEKWVENGEWAEMIEGKKALAYPPIRPDYKGSLEDYPAYRIRILKEAIEKIDAVLPHIVKP